MIATERLFSRLFLIFASVIFCFLFIEISSRIWLSCFAPEKSFRKYASYEDLVDRYGVPLLSPHRYLGYYPTPNFVNTQKANRHNSMGYRGDEIILPKPENEYRIVCIGGSTTYTVMTGYRESYPYLLQEQLFGLGHGNVTVINAGVLGWTTWESLINFQFRVLDLEPDMVILYHALNDVCTRLVWPSDAFQGDNSGYRIPRRTVSDFVKHSALIRIFAVRLGLVPPIASLKFLDRHAKTYYADDYWNQRWNDTFPSGVFTQFTPEEILETNSLVYYRRNIENLIAIAQRRGIAVILATFVYTSDFEDKVRGMPNTFISAIDEANETLKNIANETGVFLFDFAEIFPRDTRYFSDSTHVNQQGSALKARSFANFIHENRLIPNPE